MDNKQLIDIQRIFETQVENGNRIINLNATDFRWLLDQAEKAQRLEEAIQQTVDTMSGYDQFKYKEILVKSLTNDKELER